jgi:YVTN family beta-propeller protein
MGRTAIPATALALACALLVASVGRGAAQPPAFRLYVANQFADTISVVDGATFTVREQIPTGKNPHEILVDEARGVAYAGNRQEDTVSVLDLKTHEEVARIASPGMPHGLVLSKDGATLFVTGAREINVIDVAARKLVSTIPVGQAPHMLHRTPDAARAFTGNMRDGTVSAIDLASRRVLATIPVGKTPEDLAISPDGTEIVAGNQDEDSITIVDAKTLQVKETVKLPPQGAPIRIRYTPDGTTIFIASRRDGAGILRMDRATRKITGHIPLKGLCVGMNFSPDRTQLYITDLRGGTISQVDLATLKVLKSIETGAGADCIEVVTGR